MAQEACYCCEPCCIPQRAGRNVSISPEHQMKCQGEAETLHDATRARPFASNLNSTSVLMTRRGSLP
ncbi:Uncharacterized protein DAT39_002807 [Clarias magur]|uniref:Uncharacterized protein n=1 Tax=Clarias magur TaxID=1594786 RepID=A0A8J4XA16_CLAMG|nr:Uncharacterized protein DAT39_002807 [Clarias magur]